MILRVRPCGVAFEEVCQEFSAAAWKVFLFEQRAGGGEDFVEVLKFEDFDVLVYGVRDGVVVGASEFGVMVGRGSWRGTGG